MKRFANLTTATAVTAALLGAAASQQALAQSPPLPVPDTQIYLSLVNNVIDTDFSVDVFGLPTQTAAPSLGLDATLVYDPTLVSVTNIVTNPQTFSGQPILTVFTSPAVTGVYNGTTYTAAQFQGGVGGRTGFSFAAGSLVKFATFTFHSLTGAPPLPTAPIDIYLSTLKLATGADPNFRSSLGYTVRAGNGFFYKGYGDQPTELDPLGSARPAELLVAVPEPGSVALFAGFATTGLALLRKRRRA